MLTKLIVEGIVNSVKCNLNCDSFNPYFVNTVKSLMTKWNICKFNIYLCIVVQFLLIMPIFDIDWDTLSTTESQLIFLFNKIRCVTFSVQETTKAEWKLYSIICVFCLFDCGLVILCQCWQNGLWVSVDKVHYERNCHCQHHFFAYRITHMSVLKKLIKSEFVNSDNSIMNSGSWNSSFLNNGRLLLKKEHFEPCKTIAHVQAIILIQPCPCWQIY